MRTRHHFVQHSALCAPQGRCACRGVSEPLRVRTLTELAPLACTPSNPQDLDGVERWLGKMAEARVPWDTYTFNAQLAALARAGRHDDAWALYRDMDEQQVAPDHVSFHILVRENGTACGYKGGGVRSADEGGQAGRPEAGSAVRGADEGGQAGRPEAGSAVRSADEGGQAGRPKAGSAVRSADEGGQAGRPETGGVAARLTEPMCTPTSSSQARRRGARANRFQPDGPRCPAGHEPGGLQRRDASVRPPRGLRRRPLRLRAGACRPRAIRAASRTDLAEWSFGASRSDGTAGGCSRRLQPCPARARGRVRPGTPAQSPS